jgi:endonuclease/exonuclease/phosphatase family metal-dependent hydrolase
MNIGIVTLNCNQDAQGQLKHVFALLAEEYAPDFFILQEAPVGPRAMPIPPRYAQIYLGGSGSCENHALWQRVDSSWRCVHTVAVPSRFCPTPRKTFVTLIVNTATNKTAQLVNVHLCGGRYDEKTLGARHASEHRRAKLDALQAILPVSVPTIVCGDFNSDLNRFFGFTVARHQAYLEKHGFSAADACQWNCTPYVLLTAAGFTLADFRHTDAHTSTCEQQTAVDSIWFANGFRHMMSAHWLTPSHFTDHDAVYAWLHLPDSTSDGERHASSQFLAGVFHGERA